MRKREKDKAHLVARIGSGHTLPTLVILRRASSHAEGPDDRRTHHCGLKGEDGTCRCRRESPLLAKKTREKWVTPSDGLRSRSAGVAVGAVYLGQVADVDWVLEVWRRGSRYFCGAVGF